MPDHAMPQLPAISFRMTVKDSRILEALRVHLDVPTKSEALRHLLREWAKEHEPELLERR